MDYIHIKNLEKYHPGYMDRPLKWAKIYFTVIDGEPEFEMLNEIDKWRFIAFIILELVSKKPIPIYESYLKRKGFDLKKRAIHLTIKALQPFIETRNVVDEIAVKTRYESVTQSRVEKDKEKEESKSRVEGSYASFEVDLVTAWNDFTLNHPSLSGVEKISEARRNHLKKRFESDHFRDNFSKVLEMVPKCQFLMGENKSGWRVSFDWLIGNDTNYLKVLEGKYKDKEKNGVGRWLKE